MYDNLKVLTINGLKKSLNRLDRAKLRPKEQSSKKPSLDEVIVESNKVLGKFKGVWPFDFFPDEVLLDKQAITIVRHHFWGVFAKITCHYDDLVNSQVNVGPLFGSLNIYSKYFTDGEEVVKWFSNTDAQRIHAILQGLLIARKEGVDLKETPDDELLTKLHKIGTHTGL